MRGEQPGWTNASLSSRTSHLHINAMLFFYCCVTNYLKLNHLATYNYLIFHGLEVPAWFCQSCCSGSHKAEIKVSAKLQFYLDVDWEEQLSKLRLLSLNASLVLWLKTYFLFGFCRQPPSGPRATHRASQTVQLTSARLARELSLAI